MKVTLGQVHPVIADEAVPMFRVSDLLQRIGKASGAVQVRHVNVCNTGTTTIKYRLYLDTRRSGNITQHHTETSGDTFDVTTALFYDVLIEPKESMDIEYGEGSGPIMHDPLASIAFETNTASQATCTISGVIE